MASSCNSRRARSVRPRRWNGAARASPTAPTPAIARAFSSTPRPPTKRAAPAPATRQRWNSRYPCSRASMPGSPAAMTSIHSAGRSEGKPTYRMPASNIDRWTMVRLHANYATSFRAPDMNYIYQSQVIGYFACDYGLLPLRPGWRPAGDLPVCQYLPWRELRPGRQPQARVRERALVRLRRGVHSAGECASCRVDYWNIRIDDEVTLLDADLLLRTEAACRLGTLERELPQCVDALGRVERNPPNCRSEPERHHEYPDQPDQRLVRAHGRDWTSARTRSMAVRPLGQLRLDGEIHPGHEPLLPAIRRRHAAGSAPLIRQSQRRFGLPQQADHHPDLVAAELVIDS